MPRTLSRVVRVLLDDDGNKVVVTGFVCHTCGHVEQERPNQPFDPERHSWAAREATHLSQVVEAPRLWTEFKTQ